MTALVIYLSGTVLATILLLSMCDIRSVTLSKRDFVVLPAMVLMWPLVLTIGVSVITTIALYYLVRGVLRGIAIGVDKI